MKMCKKLLSLCVAFIMIASISPVLPGFPGILGDEPLVLGASAPSTAITYTGERQIRINDGWRFNLLTEQSVTNAASRGLDGVPGGEVIGAQAEEPGYTCPGFRNRLFPGYC